MAIAISDIIDADDYNGIRNKIVKVLGDDSVNAKIGYGRGIASSAKSAGDVITAADMTALFTDLEKIREHHTGFASNNASFTWGYSDGLNSPDAAEIVGVFAADVGDTDSQDATEDTDEGFIDFDSVADNAVTFANNFPTSFPGSGSFTVDGLVSDPRTSDWNGTISHQITVRWTSADQRRYFFNAGGRIRFAASLTGGNSVAGDQTATYPSVPEYQKDEIWQTMLNVMETIDFGRDTTTQPINASGSPAAIGNYQMTSSDQVIFTKNGTGVYAENYYEIKAREVDTRSIRFTISFVDADIGDDRIVDGYTYRTDENVTGDITSVIQSVTPDVFLNISAPSYVEDSTLEGSTPAVSYGLSANVTEVNEGGTFGITLDTTGLPNGTLVPYTISGVQSSDIGGVSLTGNFNINSNSDTISFTASEDFFTDGADEVFALSLDNGLGGTAEVIIRDTSLGQTFSTWPSSIPHALWGTKSYSESNTGGTPSATADLTVTNNGNGSVTVASRTFDSSEASPTSYSGTITYTNLVGTVTVEARYNVGTQNASGGGSNPVSGGSTQGTYYTIASGNSRTFTWNAVDTDASSLFSTSQAANVSFDVRITDDNGSTVLSSATGLTVDLEAIYDESAQSINTLFKYDDNSNGNVVDGTEAGGFGLASNGGTQRYVDGYPFTDFAQTPATASIVDWLPAALQGAGAGAGYEAQVTLNSSANGTVEVQYNNSAGSFNTWYTLDNLLNVYITGVQPGDNGTGQVNLKIRKTGAGTAYDVNQSVDLQADMSTASAGVGNINGNWALSGANENDVFNSTIEYGFVLNTDGSTGRIETGAGSLTRTPFNITDWLDSNLQGANAGDNWEARIVPFTGPGSTPLGPEVKFDYNGTGEVTASYSTWYRLTERFGVYIVGGGQEQFDESRFILEIRAFGSTTTLVSHQVYITISTIPGG